jgi:hypothetical protein
VSGGHVKGREALHLTAMGFERWSKRICNDIDGNFYSFLLSCRWKTPSKGVNRIVPEKAPSSSLPVCLHILLMI